MAGRHYWLVNGKIWDDSGPGNSDPAAAWSLMSDRGAVRLISGPHGTEMRWAVAAPHVLSLFAAEAMLAYMDGPYMLRFYAAGWFEECYNDLAEVRRRLGALVMHGDRHLASRVFVRAPEPAQARVPDILREVLRDGEAPRELAVECTFEPDLDAFVVRHVGARSAIGRIWGTDPTSFPCLAQGPLASSAGQSYQRALNARAPIYEQVMAALRYPDDTLHWTPYHRVILPLCEPGARTQAVQVVSACAEVEFRVL
jgi:hypothetical protein